MAKQKDKKANELMFQKIPVKKKVKAINDWQRSRKANRKAKQQMQEVSYNG